MNTREQTQATQAAGFFYHVRPTYYLDGSFMLQAVDRGRQLLYRNARRIPFAQFTEGSHEPVFQYGIEVVTEELIIRKEKKTLTMGQEKSINMFYLRLEQDDREDPLLRLWVYGKIFNHTSKVFDLAESLRMYETNQALLRHDIARMNVSHHWEVANPEAARYAWRQQAVVFGLVTPSTRR